MTRRYFRRAIPCLVCALLAASGCKEAPVTPPPGMPLIEGATRAEIAGMPDRATVAEGLRSLWRSRFPPILLAAFDNFSVDNCYMERNQNPPPYVFDVTIHWPLEFVKATPDLPGIDVETGVKLSVTIAKKGSAWYSEKNPGRPVIYLYATNSIHH
jgi:hypothetical protein